MKSGKFFFYFLLLALLLWPSQVFAREAGAPLFEDKVVFGGSYTLESGESLDGSLVVFGGAVTLEADSSVYGDVVLLGGTLEVNGSVSGSLVGIGGVVSLNDGALIEGDAITFGAVLERADGSRVNGQIVDSIGSSFNFDLPEGVNVDTIETPVPIQPMAPWQAAMSPVFDWMWFLFSTFMWAALAVLVVIFFTKPTERVAKAALSQPLTAGGAGLLTAILSPFALVALTLTIILIPVTIIAALVLLVAWLFGMIALGLEVGRRIAALFNAEWAPAIAAGVGTFVLYFVLGGFAQLIDCIGWIPQVLVGMWGWGAVILTRFGTQALNPSQAEVAPVGDTLPPSAQASQPVLEVVETTIPEDGFATGQPFESSHE